jgi:hypothetical protein
VYVLCVCSDIYIRTNGGSDYRWRYDWWWNGGGTYGRNTCCNDLSANTFMNPGGAICGMGWEVLNSVENVSYLFELIKLCFAFWMSISKVYLRHRGTCDLHHLWSYLLTKFDVFMLRRRCYVGVGTLRMYDNIQRVIFVGKEMWIFTACIFVAHDHQMFPRSHQ